MYALIIMDEDLEAITKPFVYPNVKAVKQAVLVTSEDKYIKMSEEAEKILKIYGVETDVIKGNVNDPKQMFLLARELKKERGEPAWINISSKHAIAVVAFALSFQRSDMIYYYKQGEVPKVTVVEMSKIEKAFKGLEKAVPILNFIRERGEVEFEEIKEAFPGESEATISRRLTQLKEAGILESRGAGRGRQRKRFCLGNNYFKSS
ncbi:MAG: winged helix-turn-helix domain-containing protein [Candidatus Parvarchaeota archaeon]